MRSTALGILLGLGLGLAGCVSTSNVTPEETIKSAVSVARHGRIKSARTVMTGSALDAFGTKEGLAALHGKLSEILSIDPPELIGSDQGDQGYGHQGDIRRVFSTKVSGLTETGAPASYTAHITCKVTYEEVHTPEIKGICTLDPNNPGGMEQCDPDTPAFDWEGEAQHCRLSEIAVRSVERP
ncbi:MAG: hypothetical protein ACJ76N_32125 [Thermoanaerobaculia bacterium]